ncbi:ethanolamine ammonia-lyase reactivating factor EutA, partial [Chloroflexota bacterium]
SPLTRKLMVTPPLSHKGRIDKLIFSGGVSEYIYGYEEGDYSDLGRMLGKEIRQSVEGSDFGVPLCQSRERIRATVIGAAQYTVQVSGSTIFLSRGNILPLRDLQVVAPRLDVKRVSVKSIESSIHEAFRQLDLEIDEKPVAVALRWEAGPSYPLLRILAQGIAGALEKATRKGFPLVLVFDNDIARLIGSLLKEEMKVTCDVVSIDGIELQDFDYIDIGEELPDAKAVPVVVKSLVFR